MASAEAKSSAFQALYSDLKAVLKSGVGDLTDKAFSKGLISEEVKSQVTSRLVSLTEGERTQIFLDAINNGIKVDGSAFEDFLAILEDEPAFSTLGQRLRKQSTKMDVQQSKSNVNGEILTNTYVYVFIGIPNAKWPCSLSSLK